MATEDGSRRSVADYFVVAGLPQENPQLLDEQSLEVNLKHSAYQDPITDIAVRLFPFPVDDWTFSCLHVQSGPRICDYYFVSISEVVPSRLFIRYTGLQFRM